MQMIGDAFNIILFMSLTGGAFTILSLLAGRIFRFSVPLWFSICQMAAYLMPLPMPGLYLIPPEPHFWRRGYYIACVVWLCGIVILTVCDITKMVFAHRAVRMYQVCRDSRIHKICAHCVQLIGTAKAPSVCFGTLDDPACVLGVLHPVIILNETMIRQLTDTELAAVLCHEITHIRRGHLLLGRIYDYICILHWFNPFAWIAKEDFAVYCELDCDRSALRSLRGEATSTDYASTMLHLLELSAIRAGKRAEGMGALGFLLAKKRIALMLYQPARAGKIAIHTALAALLAIVILFSMTLSRGYFYPYPAYDKGVEYHSGSSPNLPIPGICKQGDPCR